MCRRATDEEFGSKCDRERAEASECLATACCGRAKAARTRSYWSALAFGVNWDQNALQDKGNNSAIQRYFATQIQKAALLGQGIRYRAAPGRGQIHMVLAPTADRLMPRSPILEPTRSV